MDQVEFEPTIAVFERAKTVHALDRVATVIGTSLNNTRKNYVILQFSLAVTYIINTSIMPFENAMDAETTV
jgi:hypothetical protein